MQNSPIDAATSAFDLLGGYPAGRITPDGEAGDTSFPAGSGRIGSIGLRGTIIAALTQSIFLSSRKMFPSTFHPPPVHQSVAVRVRDELALKYARSWVCAVAFKK